MPLGLYGKTVTLATGTKGKVENAVVINQDGRTTINRGLVTDNMYFGSTDNNTSFSNAPGMSRWFNPNINADHTHVSSGGANSQLFLMSKKPVKILKDTGTWGSSGDLEVDGNLTASNFSSKPIPDNLNLGNTSMTNTKMNIITLAGGLSVQYGEATTSHNNWTVVKFNPPFKMLISWAAYDRDSGGLITRYAGTPNNNGMTFDNQQAGSNKLPAKWVALGII
jgi:hypothetical protein